MNRQLELDLAIRATLDCDYELDDPYVDAIVDRAPDRCEPASGGAVCELVLTVRDVCVEDEKRDLLNGCSIAAGRAFAVALQTLLIEYDDRTRVYAEQLEALDRTGADDRE